MKLVTYMDGSERWTGAVVDDQVVPLTPTGGSRLTYLDVWERDSRPAEDKELLSSRGGGTDTPPRTMVDLIAGGEAALQWVREVASRGTGAKPLSEVKLLAPIPRPLRNILCVGWNYQEHFDEGQGKRGNIDELPEFPTIFTKAPTSVVGQGADVLYVGHISDTMDWEVELAVIIGRPGRDISQAEAFDHVFGYTVANDVSVRAVQRRHGGQWHRGKTMDTHGPLGPWIVAKDELTDPDNLDISSRINGVVKQSANTRDMVFKIPRLVEELSMGTTLQPGDIILTGTPSGVGFARTPPEYLKPGDVMEMTVQGIGTLTNRVVEYR